MKLPRRFLPMPLFPWVLLLSLVAITVAQNTTSVADIAKATSKSVVRITVRDASDKPLAVGSGFIVRADGIIVTNHHVIEGASAASVEISNGDTYDAVFVVDADKRKDLAILRIKALNLPVAKLGDSDSLQVGQHVVAIGNPRGFLTDSISDGIVSAVRQFEGYKAIQTTAPISEGSSGGPLLNDLGEVIGITAGTFEGQNLNIAIPVNYAKPLLRFLNESQQKTLAEFNAGALKTAAAESETHRDARPSDVKVTSIDGSWSATFADNRGSGHLDFNLIQNSDGDVVGTYTSSLGGGGSIKGTVKDTDLSFELTQSLKDCPGVFKARGHLADTKIAGAYVGTDCLGDHGSGSFTMTRVANAAAIQQSVAVRVPDAMKENPGAYLEKQLRVWTPENARLVLGEPIRHRYSYAQDRIDGDINAYTDPTRLFREFELRFDKANMLTNVFVYPWSMTWEQCKQLWGEKTKTIKNTDGTRFYMYKNRRLNVLVNRDGSVISFGVY